MLEKFEGIIGNNLGQFHNDFSSSLIKNNIQVDYICKIHTKTDDDWRNDMINPLCGTTENITKCINKFDQN